MLVDLLRLVFEERRGARPPRVPEPDPVMADPATVNAFHTEGEKVLRPVYLFNARAVARLAPRCAKILDLGCGSGQFLQVLAALRPDLSLVGVEPSRAMRARGQREIEAQGLTGRLQLVEGDMTDLVERFPGPYDVVSSLFALHHLPAASDLFRCFDQLRRLRDRDQSALWLFDHARPRGRGVPEGFARIFARGLSPLFQRDSANSLAAAFTFSEWQTTWQEVGLPPARHALARVFPFYQCLRLEGPRVPHRPLPEAVAFDALLRARASAFAFLFPGMS